MKDKTKVESRVSNNQCAGINFSKLLWEASKKEIQFRSILIQFRRVDS